MISIILKIQCCWMLFFGFYYLFLRKETYFNANRYYLIASILLGLVIPFLPALNFYQSAAPISNFDAILPIVDFNILQITATPIEDASHSYMSVIVLCLYLIGVLIMTGRFLLGIYKIYQIYQDGNRQKKGNYILIRNGQKHTAFSFFNLLFIANTLEGEDFFQVIDHELSHIRGKHSIDILLVELLNIVFWFSPFVYWFKQSIRINHEYIADLETTRTRNRSDYGRLLLNYAQKGSVSNFVHYIFKSPLKTRIQMMYTKRTGRLGLLKYFSILPLGMFILFFFSNSEIKAELENMDDNFELFVEATDTIPPAPPSPTTAPPKPPKPPKALAPPKPATSVIPPTPPPPPSLTEEDEVFIVVEQMPRFPGCEDIENNKERKNCADTKMLEFIYKNLSYPAEARKNSIEGRVVLQFVVMKDGSIGNITVVRDIGGGCGEAAKATLELMNEKNIRWIPARQRGKDVDLKYTLPVTFKLEKKKEKKETPKSDGRVMIKKTDENVVTSIFTNEENNEEKADPIFILDDKKVSQAPDQLDPDDIASIDVRKDIEIIKKYGNGNESDVIFIYTKAYNKQASVLTEVDEMPRFPGCENINGDKTSCSNSKMIEYISANLKYPTGAKEDKIQGKVIAQFVVDAGGNIKNIHIINSLRDDCDKEVLRILEGMNSMNEKWIPGKKDGKKVSVKLTLPFSFALPKAK